MPRCSPSVSQALWPKTARYSVSTDSAAQQRRLLITLGLWQASHDTSARVRWRRALVALLALLSTLSLLALGAFLATFVPHPWSLLFGLSIFWLLTALSLTWLLVREKREHYVDAKTLKAYLREDIRTYSAIVDDEFPETPLPRSEAPTVRVMETINLSSSDVRHFLRTTDSHLGHK
ncbi:hypothetical protein KSX_20220 [Ktedonospora formicarum]|uniref:Uncharacterized protein n=1 Tax=Ktedonospora formicarum TaxID=2778364 RepID=A0A8J3HU96_9CHLR|nr:hypothetical protein KSX_20220 [Ktedonospora formicarum]